MSENKYLIAQLGARMHYAVPVSFHRAGRLAGLATDVYLRDWQSKLCDVLPLPDNLCAKLRRYRADLPTHLVVCNQAGWLRREMRRTRDVSPLGNARMNDDSAKALARTAARIAKNQPVNTVYAFDTAAVEVFDWARTHGIKCVLEQCVIPRAGQERILSNLMDKYGGSVTENMQLAWRHLAVREKTEWAQADLILCPSEFVSKEVIAAGGAAEKTAIVPYGVQPPPGSKFSEAMQRRAPSAKRPLRVLFVGEAGLRKGLLDLMAAAAQLPATKFEWIVAGRINLSPGQLQQAKQYLKLTGPLNKAQLADEYMAANVFVLPTYLEGSATVTYEALGWGLPVVTTMEAGSVVEHGRSGFVGRAGDVDFLVRSLQALAGDDQLRAAMSIAARKRAGEYDIAAYGKRLLDALATLEK
jgi:glycosyltransferase involved in cell wall biosynthesis